MYGNVNNMIADDAVLTEIPIQTESEAGDRSVQGPRGAGIGKKSFDQGIGTQLLDVEGRIMQDIRLVVKMPRGIQGIEI